MTALPAAELLVGRTFHSREHPFRRAFSYGVTMIRIDIDRLAEANGMARLFRVNRLGAFAFHTRDHGERRKGASLRTWAEARFAEAGVNARDGRIDLVTFPRVLGYGFAPISLWISHQAAGRPQGAIFEVHNTFGETHAYVGAFSPEHTTGEVPKNFFVSPFFDVSGGYSFAFRYEDGRLELSIENRKAGVLTHKATLAGQTSPITDQVLGRQLASSPFSGHGVFAAILLQALRLWRKGAKYHVRPAAEDARTTVVTAVDPAPPPVQEARLSA